MPRTKEEIYKNINLICLALIFILLALSYSIYISVNSVASKITIIENELGNFPVETKFQGQSLVYDLTEVEEQKNWLAKGYENCSTRKISAGIITDLCFCNFSTSVEKEIMIPSWGKELRFVLCAEKAGGDGVFGIVTVSNFKSRIFIPSNTCVTNSVSIARFANTKQKIELSTERNGLCEQELVIWKVIEFIG
ncbi:MAG: hypothetical protein OH319_00270 [Candidatus Parvarchaeota archaeon]|nr:hypothetical protein [Candidatus Jingweiarchaeum tengchongense]MCW1298421.1 hypothetical protein [Candidatus Jingweiarchaeum tengchongense]MCW1310114.1 hypothetical protein [Candidatus Jingweiarchaeum tengchongense]MCW1310831.1 hypothetical protein [Candidatus Jingweiarchaeum tengchongense]